MLTYLWFLLPVAFLFGWWTGRKTAHDTNTEIPESQSSYFRGLNYLANERKDEAIELFVGISYLSNEMAETQLALGNWFRDRGEVDRAIKIHQDLVERRELLISQNGIALLALARDYTKSGLLDRAEDLYEELLKLGLHLEDAYEALISVYEREQDWPRAIKLVNDSRLKTGVDHNKQLGHYYCELAESAYQVDSDNIEARTYLKQALEADPNSSRANILRGQFAMQRADYEKAIICFQTVEQQNPELISEIIMPLFKAFSELKNDVALREYLEYVQSRYNPYTVIVTTRAMIEKLDGPIAAEKFFKQQILKRPSLRALRDWAQFEYQKSKPGEQEKISVIIGMLNSVVKDKPAYICGNCGFTAKNLFWHCPSCCHWDSMKTIIGVEGE